MTTSRAVFLLLFVVTTILAPASEPAVKTTKWNGYVRLDFSVADRPCLLVRPA
ncbi:MAG: hypothetical protein JNL39_13605, partial [Opitutaceae bacterium]|nr:hypothetical protein [Opitutaceae bacterium]